MKPGIPWSVKGIEGKAREVAKDAARAQGMTLGEWLNQKILDAAHEDADLKSRATRKKASSSVSSDNSKPVTRTKPTIAKARTSAPASSASIENTEIVRKLDELVGRLSNIDAFEARREPEPAHVLSSHHSSMDETANTLAMQRLLDRIEKGENYTTKAVNTLGEKVERIGERVEEIAERPLDLKARELPGFSALEGAVRNIVEHIDKSEKQSREVMSKLQSRIIELDGKFQQPEQDSGKPHIIADLETRMQELAARVEQASTSQPETELKSLFEARLRELAERIDTVRHSTESMSQKAQATASKAVEEQAAAIENRLAHLVEQAEMKLAESGPGDKGMISLQAEISNLHTRFEEVRQQAASEQEVRALRTALDKLSSRVDETPALEPIAQIEHRIAELSEQLQKVSAATDYQPQFGALEERVHALDSQLAAASTIAPQADPYLMEKMGSLEQRLAATEGQLGSLATIESAVQKLFASLEENRAEARAMVEGFQSGTTSFSEPSAELKALEEGLAAVRENAQSADQRTQETLEAVHETLAQIITKLSEIDSTAKSGPRQSNQVSQAVTGNAAQDFTESLAEASAAIAQGDRAAPAVPDVEIGSGGADAGEYSPFGLPGDISPIPAPSFNDHASVAQQAQAESSDWLSVVRSHMAANHGVNPAVDGFSSSASAMAHADGHTDFIAAARRAASSATPNAPAGAMMTDFGTISPNAGSDKERSRLSALLSRSKTGSGSSAKASQTADGSSRKRLVLAGAVLLAAVSAYAANSGMFSPQPVKQSSLEVPAVVSTQEPVSTSSVVPSQAVVELPASAPPVEIPSQAQNLTEGQTDPITTASVNTEQTTDPLLSNAPSALGQSLATANAPVEQAENLPEEIGTAELRQAAMSGDASAQFIVASKYLEGRVIGRSHEKAAQWYLRAANAGLAAAQYRIGTLYERGSGVPQDRFQAMSWYAKAATQGNVKSMHNLAVMSADTTSGKADMARAAKWFAAAAEHGLPDSQYNLAVLNERGIGVQKNINEAYKWYALAAKRGDRDAISKAEALNKSVDQATLAQIDAVVAAWQPKEPVREANLVAVSDPTWGVNGDSQQQASAQPVPVPQPATQAPVETLTASDQVKLAQKLLAQKGFDAGEADGQMGSRTANAIRLYQLRSGLPVNGSVSRQLLEHLQQGLI